MFEVNKFIDHIHSSFNGRLTKEDVRELLYVDNYEKDSPDSLGKRLLISQLKIIGKKNTGELINYHWKIHSGVNVLYADNGKGKSSVFKIIQFALTGDKDSIKKDVLSWLHEIFMEFIIGNISYTVYIDLTGKRVKSVLYKVSLNDLLRKKEKNEKVEDILVHFEVKSLTSFREKMQEFFFNQFSYYSLTWTSARKGTINLQDNNTSWKTYFKSIYLQSKDYNVLFFPMDYGNQGKKVLEMILGLRLTYPINALSQKRDYLINDLKKQEFLKDSERNITSGIELEQEIKNITQQIEEIQENRKATFRKTADLKVYNQFHRELKLINDELRDLISQKIELERQIVKLKKNIIRLEEDIDFGLYFSNLEIKICPRCETDIKSERKYVEKTQHKCMLCENELEEIDEDQREFLTTKISDLKHQLEMLENGLIVLKNLIEQKEIAKKNYTEKLEEIENKMNVTAFEEKDIDLLANLIERKIKLEYEYKVTVEDDNKANMEKIKEKIRVIDHALNYLNEWRLRENEEILKRLSTLILQQLNEFGLTNVNEVIINENLEILFEQNGHVIKFTELNEGEQLRAKIAFFLSLILLDIQYKVGRHSRLLIIDSPGKEEIISKDLESLAKTFRDIEKNYGQELQIIIGTALEQLKDATVEEKLVAKEEGENVF